MSALLEKIQKKRQELQRTNINRPEKLASEKNLVRILPEWSPTGDFSQNWGQHFIKDTTGNLKAVYVCTKTNFDEECPVCQAISEGMAMTSDEDILKALKDSRSSKRILVNALYLKGGKHEKPETTPVVLDLPPTVWEAILTTAETFMAEGVNVFDLDEGHNFVIEKTGSGMNTEYKVTPSPRSTKVNVIGDMKDLAQWARQESEADKAKAVTSVRVIAGASAAAALSAPRIAHGGGASNSARLSAVSVDDVIDADFDEITTRRSGVVDDVDDFLNSLGN